MYDSTIHPETLARQLRPADFVADPHLLDSVYRMSLLADAARFGDTGFTGLTLRINQLRGKAIYGLTDLRQLLVLRHITANIRRITGVRQDDRRFIVECMASLLREGVAFRLYKFDIAAFYESTNASAICSALSDDVAFSGQSMRVLRTFFLELDKAGVAGLPRGLSISATLAEYLMRGFDKFVSNTGGVLYYSRFVDDICIITDGSEDAGEFKSLLSDNLASGLTFNAKSETCDFTVYSKLWGNTPEHSIDYLGYRITVSFSFRPSGDNTITRDVWLDISPRKVRRLKSRLVATFLQHRKDGNLLDLRDRIRVLTGNFSLRDRTSGVPRIAGIRFNYPLVDATRSKALDELDQFLRNGLMSAHPRNKIRPNLTSAQRLELAKYTFRRGFEKKTFFHFSPGRLAHLTKCWAYV